MSKGFVVVGVDVPETSGDAVRWAAHTASLHGATMKLVHAVDEVEGLPRGVVSADDTTTRELLEDHTEELSALAQVVDEVRASFPDVKIEPVEVVGDAVEVLLDHQSDSLVVVGSGHRNALAELVLGSTSLGVAMHASSPVVVVPPGSHDAGEPHGTIAVAVDGSADSAVAARAACYEAELRGARVLGIKTWGLQVVDGYVVTESDQEEFAAMQERQRQQTEKALVSARRDFPEVQIDLEVVHAKAVPTLVERSSSVDLIVLGSRGLGGFVGKLLGSVSQQVLRGSACPVMVVKAT